MKKFKSEKGVSLIALIIFLVMIILAAGIIVVMIISTNKNKSTEENKTENTSVNTTSDNSVTPDSVNTTGDATENVTENTTGNTTEAVEAVVSGIDHIVIAIEDTESKEGLKYKEKTITDKSVITSLVAPIIAASDTPYESENFIPDLGDIPPMYTVYNKNGEVFLVAAGDEIKDGDNYVNVFMTWPKDKDEEKELYKIDVKYGELIINTFNEN